MEVRFLLGEQTGKGTAKLDELKLLHATSSNVVPNVSKVTSQAIGTGRWERDGFVSKVEVNGDVTVEATAGQLEMFLKGAGFKVDVKGKNKEALPDKGFNTYLTYLTDNIEADLYEYAKDCLVSSLTINAQLEAYITATANMIGMDHVLEKNAKFNGKVVDFDGKSLICLGTTIKEKNTDITAEIENVEVTIDNKLEGKGALNSVYYKAIRQGDRGSVSLNLQFNEFNKTSYANAHEMLRNNTSYEVTLEFAEIEDNTKKVKIEFPNCKISNVEATDLENAGGLSKELNAYYDEKIKSPVKITFENYVATTG